MAAKLVLPNLFAAMNSTDLRTLLAAPPLSRATFFAQLLAKPSIQPQDDPLFDDQTTDSVSEPDSAPAPAAPVAPTSFPA